MGHNGKKAKDKKEKTGKQAAKSPAAEKDKSGRLNKAGKLKREVYEKELAHLHGELVAARRRRRGPEQVAGCRRAGERESSARPCAQRRIEHPRGVRALAGGGERRLPRQVPQ